MVNIISFPMKNGELNHTYVTNYQGVFMISEYIITTSTNDSRVKTSLFEILPRPDMMWVADLGMVYILPIYGWNWGWFMIVLATSSLMI